MAFKRCHEKGCDKAPRCPHRWHIRAQRTLPDGRVQIKKGTVDKFAFLLDPGQLIPQTKAEAEDLEKRLELWLKRGARPEDLPPPPNGGGQSPTPEPPAGPTIREVATDYKVRHLKIREKPDGTVVNECSDKGEPSRTNRIIAKLGDRPMADLLKRRVLQDYLDDLHEDKESVASYNRAFARLSNLITHCRLDFGLTGPSPFFHRQMNPMGVRKKDETPRRRGEFKAGEEAALLKALKAFDDGGMMLGRFYCATGAGPRRREMLELRSKTGIIDTPGRGLGISLRFLGETTKSGKPRDVPVATNELLQFVVSRRHLEFPFGQLDGTRLDSFREDWEAVLLAAGLEAGEWRGRTWVRTKDADLHWHDLRHVFATRLLVRGIRGGIRRIQKLLGHADIQTTMTYLNVDEDDDADAMVEVNMPQKTRKKRTLKAVA